MRHQITIRVKGKNKQLLKEFFQTYIWVRYSIRKFLNKVNEVGNDITTINRFILEKLFSRNKYSETSTYKHAIKLAKYWYKVREISKQIPQMFVMGIIKEWTDNMKSIISLRRMGRKASNPSPKVRNSVSILFDGNLLKKIDNNLIQLVIDKHRKILLKCPINVSRVKSVRITYFPHIGEFEASIIYEVGYVESNVNEDKWLSIDLGVKNFVSAISNVESLNSFIISSGWLLSLKHWEDDKISQLRHMIDKYNLTYLRKQENRIRYYVKRRIKTTLHQLTSKIIDICLANNIGTIIIGYNVVDANRNSSKEKTISKEIRRKLFHLPFAKFIEMIKYKAEKYGIKVILQDESYTSKTSSITETPEKQDTYNGIRKGSLFIDKAINKVFHADLNAALNIAKKALNITTVRLQDWIKKLCNPMKFSFNKFITRVSKSLALSL